MLFGFVLLVFVVGTGLQGYDNHADLESLQEQLYYEQWERAQVDCELKRDICFRGSSPSIRGTRQECYISYERCSLSAHAHWCSLTRQEVDSCGR